MSVIHFPLAEIFRILDDFKSANGERFGNSENHSQSFSNCKVLLKTLQIKRLIIDAFHPKLCFNWSHLRDMNMAKAY